jgi:type IV pilus assembly protein PilC
MQKYKYEARTVEGAPYKGKMSASSKEEVVERLLAKKLIIVKVQEDSGLSIEKLKEINIGGIPMKEKVVFMRQLSTMISAGLPLTQALDILQQQTENPRFKIILEKVYGDVQGGLSLSKSFRKHDDSFDEITISLLQAGEDSGNLETILGRIATELESKKVLGEKIRSAFTYPLIILVVVIGIVALLVIVLVPAMKEIYNDFGSELPWATQMLVDMSDFLINYWWAMLLFIGAIVVGLKLYLDTEAGVKVWHKLILKIPVFGLLTSKIQITQFTRILGLLLESGLSIIEALELTANSLSNVHYRAAVLETKKEVEKGVPMATPLSRSEYFPIVVSQMVGVGEESGEIGHVLNKMTDYYNSEVEVITTNLTTLLEPMILIVMGGLIGFIAFAVYTPMFSLVEVIG